MSKQESKTAAEQIAEAAETLRTLPAPAVEAMTEAGRVIAVAIDARRDGALSAMTAIRTARNALTDGKVSMSARKMAEALRVVVIRARAAAIGEDIPDTDPRVTAGVSVPSMRRYLTALALIEDTGAALTASTASAAYAAVDAGIVSQVRDAEALANLPESASMAERSAALIGAIDATAEDVRVNGKPANTRKQADDKDGAVITPASALDTLSAVAEYIGNLDTVPAEYDDNVRAILAILSGRLDTRAAQRDAEASAEGDATRRANGGRAATPGPAQARPIPPKRSKTLAAPTR
jgi:hypothetical protein